MAHTTGSGSASKGLNPVVGRTTRNIKYKEQMGCFNDGKEGRRKTLAPGPLTALGYTLTPWASVLSSSSAGHTTKCGRRHGTWQLEPMALRYQASSAESIASGHGPIGRGFPALLQCTMASGIQQFPSSRRWSKPSRKHRPRCTPQVDLCDLPPSSARPPDTHQQGHVDRLATPPFPAPGRAETLAPATGERRFSQLRVRHVQGSPCF